MEIKNLSKNNFDEIITSHPMVVVDFWAEWCGPCRVFADTFHQVSKRFEDILFAKVNIEEEAELAEDFNIRSIPFLMIFRGEIAIYAEPGALTEPALINIIERARDIDISEIKKSIDNQEEDESH